MQASRGSPRNNSETPHGNGLQTWAVGFQMRVVVQVTRPVENREPFSRLTILAKPNQEGATKQPGQCHCTTGEVPQKDPVAEPRWGSAPAGRCLWAHGRPGS